jgi:hypothetical protein
MQVDGATASLALSIDHRLRGSARAEPVPPFVRSGVRIGGMDRMRVIMGRT